MVRDAAEAAFGYVLEHFNWMTTPIKTLHRLGLLVGGGGVTGCSFV
jgi:hypothetical protein